MKIGLVLSGGGFKGSYQIGAWKAIREKLRESGVSRFHAIAGTSVGALNAVLIANDNLVAAEEIWLEKDVVRLAPRLSIIWYALGYGLLLSPVALSPFFFFAGLYRSWHSDWQPGSPVAVSFFLAGISIIAGPVVSMASDVKPVFFVLHKNRLFLISMLLLIAEFFGLGLVVLIRRLWFADFVIPSEFSDTTRFMFGLLMLPMGVACGILGVWTLSKAYRAQLFSNEGILAELADLLDVRKLQAQVRSLFVTTAVARTITDPFSRNFTGPQFKTLDMNNPGTSPTWIAEYFDLCGTNDAGEILERLRLSAALPVAFQLGTSGSGDRVADGGLADNIPIIPVLRSGVDWIIIVLLTPMQVTSDSLRKSVTSTWIREGVAGLSEDKAKALYQQWVRGGTINPTDWFPNLPQLSGKRFTIVSPSRSLAVVPRLSFLTGTLNPLRRARRTWFNQGYEDAVRMFPSATFEVAHFREAAEGPNSIV